MPMHRSQIKAHANIVYRTARTCRTLHDGCRGCDKSGLSDYDVKGIQVRLGATKGTETYSYSLGMLGSVMLLLLLRFVLMACMVMGG